MTPALKSKQTAFLLAGIGLALLAGALGWQVAGPTARKVALPELGQVHASSFTSKRQSAALVSANKTQAGAKPFLATQVPDVPSSGLPAYSTSPAHPSHPQPVAQESSQESVPPVSPAAIEKITEVDPALPGNFLVANGQRISIQQSLTGVGGTALDVVITPEPEPDKAAAGGQSEFDAAQNPEDRPGRGFTYEEELFRTKWGWAAYDAANRAATWDLQKSAPVSQ